MKQVITKQGKTFDYNQILLFNVSNDNIVVIINDKEQLNKFRLTGNSSDAPIAVIPYTEEELKEIVSSMKPIVGYTEVSPNKLSVEYGDDIKPYNTKVEFDSSNKEIIENNLIEQRKAKERNAVGNWYDTEQNKETSTVVTEEQRFKVLQIEKYEEKEEGMKGIFNLSFLTMSISALISAQIFIDFDYGRSLITLLPAIAFGGFSDFSLIVMITAVLKTMGIRKDKEEIINELKNADVDIDVIRTAIENEEEKGKGAK